MAKNECFKVTRGCGWDIVLTQQGPDDFTVAYGKKIKPKLTYEDAALELGSAIMHACACEGNLDNSDP